jgi:hypothetical protein
VEPYILVEFTDVKEESTASIFRTEKQAQKEINSLCE